MSADASVPRSCSSVIYAFSAAATCTYLAACAHQWSVHELSNALHVLGIHVVQLPLCLPFATVPLRCSQESVLLILLCTYLVH